VDIALEAAGKLIRSSLDDDKSRRLVEEYLEELPALREER